MLSSYLLSCIRSPFIIFYQTNKPISFNLFIIIPQILERAIKFPRVSFHIVNPTNQPIKNMEILFKRITHPSLFQEVIKSFGTDYATLGIVLDFGVLDVSR